MSARTRKDWILWSALGCALAGTAHAEYTLAVAAHFNEWVALAVPGALDLYVIRALQQRRDVFVAVLAMVAANVAAHLVVAGVLPVEWPVVSAVGAVAPLIVWRVYALKYESGAVSAPALGDEYPVLEHGCGWVRRALDWLGWRECGCECAPADVLVAGQGLEYGPRVKWGALETGADAPDHVPADWLAEEYPETHPSAEQVRVLDDAFQKLGPPSAVPYLAPVPDLPPEYEAGAVHSETEECALVASDWEYLPGAQEYVDKYSPATVKGLRRELRIGQDRAERLLAHLGVRP